MKPGVEVRLTAARTVGRVLRRGAFSNRLVDSTRVEKRSDSHFRFLVYTTLRHLDRIDSLIDSAGSRSNRELDPAVLDILRVAVAELVYGNAPTHAVVDSAVEATKATKRKRASGYVNAVLRTVARAAPQASAPVRSEYPEWMVDRLDRQWEVGDVDAFLAASLEDAPRQVRLRGGVAPEGAAASETIEGSYTIPPGPLPDNTVVQDAASVGVGGAVPMQPGDLVLDMAAAPGGKALHLHDRGAVVVAADLSIRRVKEGVRRWPELHWIVANGTMPPFSSETFDHILLDAPCSGLGTLRRRPEIRHRITDDDIERLARTQRLLLEQALRLVKPGGTVTYAVCTVTTVETTDVVADLPAEPPPGLPGRQWGKGILLAPHLTGTDGMFISRVERR